jgi:hypothetical protein
VEAIHTVVHILNKAHLKPHNDKTPCELWFGRPASIKHFKVFGSKCYIKNNDENIGKYSSDDGLSTAVMISSAVIIEEEKQPCSLDLFQISRWPSDLNKSMLKR